MRLCKFRNGQAAFTQGFQHRSARRIGKRTEHGVETIMLILNHKVQYGGEEIFLSRQGTRNLSVSRMITDVPARGLFQLQS